MANVSVQQIHQRLESFQQRRRYYEWKSDQPNRLALHEVWRHTYLANPYLIGATDERVAERFKNIFMNVNEITKNGKLGLVSFEETDEYMQVFTHMLEEYEDRNGGMPPADVIQSAREPILKYFEHGTPKGVAMFEGYRVPSTPFIVKYGQRQFLQAMHAAGDLRLANAALYNDMKLLDAVRDDETSRTFFLPTYKDRLAGKRHFDFKGHRMHFKDDDIILPLTFDDYYLFSLCRHIHYRMPTDFDADAAIIIKDPSLFKRRLISAFLARFPGWIPMEGAVIYYDPYRDYNKFRFPHMAKHFGYAYQKEIRVAFRPRHKNMTQLEPLFLSIGAMTDYADLVTL